MGQKSSAPTLNVPPDSFSNSIEELHQNLNIANTIAFTLSQKTRTTPFLFSMSNPQEPDVRAAQIVVQSVGDEDIVTLKVMNLHEFHATLTCLKAYRRTEDRRLRDKDDEDTNCPVCMERKKDAVLPCGHAFCAKCMAEWSSHSNSCPLCRSSDQGEAFEIVDGLSEEEMMEMLMDCVFAVEEGRKTGQQPGGGANSSMSGGGGIAEQARKRIGSFMKR
eukprot:PhF_6_TR13608/c0_g1_i1/m.21778